MPLVTGKAGSGVIDNRPSSNDLVATSQLPLTAASMDTAVVDTRWTPSKSLMQYIAGSSITVDAYYSQVLGTNDQLSGLKTSVGSVYQQYTKIVGLEIKVTNPLSPQQNQDDKTFEHTGSGIIYGGVIPNEGDVFVASIGDNQRACLKIVSSEKTTIFKASAYLVNFSVITTDPTYLSDLEGKVVNTYVFRKDFYAYGQNPLITTVDNDALINAERLIARVSSQYINRYFDEATDTLTLEDNGLKLYDHFLANFVIRTTPVNVHRRMQRLKALTVAEHSIMQQDNIFTALLNADVGYLNTGFTKVAMVTPYYFTMSIVTESIRLSGVDRCIVPADPLSSLNISGSGSYVPLSSTGASNVLSIMPIDTQISDEKLAALTDAVPRPTTQGTTLGIYPIHPDSYYVFSDDFYMNGPNQSSFEVQVRNYLTNKKVDLLRLYNTLATFTRWSPIEQFYLIPISIVILRAAIRQRGF